MSRLDHPDPAVRRRRAAVAAVAALALVAGIGVGAGGDEPERKPDAPASARAPAGLGERPPARPARKDREAVDRLRLEEQVGQLIMLRFAGTTVPEYVERVLREGRSSGVILFKDNFMSPEGVRAITRTLRRAGKTTAPLVSTDQEGGVIRNLDWLGPEASQAGQVQAASVRRDARAAARALRAHGINVTLAPVADVATVPGAAMAGRAFSDDHDVAAAAMREAVEGWTAGGVAATAKHFPGLGGATVNTDDGSATIERTREELDRDLVPFRAAVEAGVPLVMLSHARYPALDPDAIASQSPRVVELLRNELDFGGVVITDSLEAAAVQPTGTIEEASERSIRAGVDLILTTGQGSYIRVYRHLLAEARESRDLRRRVRESAARILALRRTLAQRR